MVLPSEEEFLENATPIPASSLPDPPACPICVKQFGDDPEDEAIAFPCHQTHIACRDCITRIEPNNRGEVLCPNCRTPAFKTEVEYVEDAEAIMDEEITLFNQIRFEDFQATAWDMLMMRFQRSNAVLDTHWHEGILDRSRIFNAPIPFMSTLDPEGFSFDFIASYLSDLRQDRTFYASARRHLLIFEYEELIDREEEVANLTQMMITREDLIVWPSVHDVDQEVQVNHSEFDHRYMIYRQHEIILEDFIEKHKWKIMSIIDIRNKIYEVAERSVCQYHTQYQLMGAPLPWDSNQEMHVMQQFIEAIISRGMRKAYRRLNPRNAPLLENIPLFIHPRSRDVPLLRQRYRRRWEAANRSFEEAEEELMARRAAYREAYVNSRVSNHIAPEDLAERVRNAAREVEEAEAAEAGAEAEATAAEPPPSEDIHDTESGEQELSEDNADLHASSVADDLSSNDESSGVPIEQVDDPQLLNNSTNNDSPNNDSSNNDADNTSSRGIRACIPWGYLMLIVPLSIQWLIKRVAG